MKITKVECLPVHSGWRKNFVFVKIETDAGIMGWGEAYSQYDRDPAIAAQVVELGRYLIGRDPCPTPPHPANRLRRLRAAPRLAGILLRDLRHRTGAVGHRRQGDATAGVQ